MKYSYLFGLVGLVLVGCGGSEPVAEPLKEEVKVEQETPAEDLKAEEVAPVEAEVKEEAVEDKANSNLPLAAQSEDWEFIVNNAIRTADGYATENNPAASFIGNNLDVDLVEQFGGEYEGRWLLTVINNRGNSDVDYAQLLPLFDENNPADNLDDEGKLWKVVIAKHNGVEF